MKLPTCIGYTTSHYSSITSIYNVPGIYFKPSKRVHAKFTDWPTNRSQHQRRGDIWWRFGSTILRHTGEVQLLWRLTVYVGHDTWRWRKWTGIHIHVLVISNELSSSSHRGHWQAHAREEDRRFGLHFQTFDLNAHNDVPVIVVLNYVIIAR